MKTNSYNFINLHISVWVQLFVGGIITAFLLVLFLKINFWIVAGIQIMIMVGLFVFNKGSVKIVSGIKTPTIVIKDASQSLTLDTPIKSKLWWNYTFKAQVHGSFEEVITPTAPSDNDINVMLQIEDRNGQKVTFAEKIVFGARFPNEAKYSLDTIDESHPGFKVQRVDKLVTFLDHYIVKEFLK